MLADLLTKPLSKTQFDILTRKIIRIEGKCSESEVEQKQIDQTQTEPSNVL